jgi:hypothetical protein
MSDLCSGGSIPANGFAWRDCWNLKVPNVVKMFLWRTFNNLLPTKVNLKKKVVVQSTSCPICESEEETVEHILWSCLTKSWRSVWQIFQYF